MIDKVKKMLLRICNYLVQEEVVIVLQEIRKTAKGEKVSSADRIFRHTEIKAMIVMKIQVVLIHRKVFTIVIHMILVGTK